MKRILILIAIVFVFDSASAQEKRTEIFRTMGGYHQLDQYENIRTGACRYTYYVRDSRYRYIVETMKLASSNNLDVIIRRLEAYEEFFKYDVDVSQDTPFGYLSVHGSSRMKALWVWPNNEYGYIMFGEKMIKKQIQQIKKFAAKNNIELASIN